MASRATAVSRWTFRVLRAAVTLVFLWAGAVKASDPLQFQRDVQSYQLLPASLTFAVAVYLPWLEVVAALALWLRPLAKGAEWVAFALTLLFLGAILSAWSRGLEIDCGCFGQSVGAGSSYAELLLRDIVLLGATCCLVFRRQLPELKTAPTRLPDRD